MKGVGEKRGRGRPLGSSIRQNIVEILFFMNEGYGYDISKAYLDIFPKVTMRVIYYHLNKGVETKEFKISKVKNERGEYSWGPQAQKTYYKLGSAANPKGLPKVEKYFLTKKPK